MRRLTFAAALVSTALASPAFARDGAAYIGIDAGIMKPLRTNLDFSNSTTSVTDAVQLRHKLGYDVDALGGYDFGMFRLELEGAYKHAGLKSADIAPAAGAAVYASPLVAGRVDATGHVTVGSGMLHALFDFG